MEPEPEVARLQQIVVASTPRGAEIRLGGELLGRTPRTLELASGSHTLVLQLGADTLERTIRVGRNKPDRYVWHVADGRWESGYE